MRNYYWDNNLVFLIARTQIHTVMELASKLFLGSYCIIYCSSAQEL